MATPLPLRPSVGPPLQASKWLKCPVLLETDELEDLLKKLGPFWIFLVSGILPQDKGGLTHKEFIEGYSQYVEALKRGELLENKQILAYLSAVWTVATDALYEVHLPNHQKLIKVEKPVIQLQHHRFDYSHADGKFRSMVLGQDSIQWGIQFSYPQLFQDVYFQVKTIRDTEEFPNTKLFKDLQKWMRDHTVATPFIVENKRINVPIRLGKKCFPWINRHPQLQAKGLIVQNS